MDKTEGTAKDPATQASRFLGRGESGESSLSGPVRCLDAILPPHSPTRGALMRRKENTVIPDDRLLDEMVRRIRRAGNPQRIVLFGSRARGDAHPGSDLDLLVIEETDLPRHRRAIRYLRALLGLFPAKDVVVYTPAEVAEWASVPNAFVTTALREGRILYGG